MKHIQWKRSLYYSPLGKFLNGWGWGWNLEALIDGVAVIVAGGTAPSREAARRNLQRCRKESAEALGDRDTLSAFPYRL